MKNGVIPEDGSEDIGKIGEVLGLEDAGRTRRVKKCTKECFMQFCPLNIVLVAM